MWEELAIPVLQLLAAGAGLWIFRRRHVPWQKEAVKIARACGLQVKETGLPLRACTGSMEVKIAGSINKDMDLQVAIAAPELSKITILHRRAKHSYQYSWTAEIATGDPGFDSVFRVEGPLSLVSAVLDARTRSLLRGLSTRSRLDLVGGELRAEMFSWNLPSTLPHLLEVGRRLSQPLLDIAQCLAENSNRDPEPGVRLQSLAMLVQERPGRQATLEALRAACWDASTQVRLLAARELGAEGRDVLLEFAESTEDETLSAGAVSILDRELPFERANAILMQALRRRRLLTARACLEVLGRCGAAEAVDVLAKVVVHERGDLAVTAAKSLEATGSPAAEPPLIQALQSDLADLQAAAAEALGHIGSAASVLPLQEAEENAGRNSELQRAARQAIAEIQSRLPGASPGQLSLAGTEAGQLSLAQSEAGQLSLATDPAGQLSLQKGDGDA